MGESPDYDKLGTRQVVTSFSITQGDREMLDWLAKKMGSNKSDIVRSSIRVFYALMKK